MAESQEPAKKNRIQQFAILFFVIILMFFFIEVAPLHFGPKQMPWQEIPMHLKHRIPIILLIAISAAGYLTFSNKVKKD